MDTQARSRAQIAAIYLTGAGLALISLLFWHNPLWVLAALWSGLSLAAVGIAYALNNPMIFRKSSSGEIPLIINWLLIPFFLGVTAFNLWQRRRDDSPNVQRIDEDLYVAGRLLPDDVPELRSIGIGAVLDITAEFNALDSSLFDEPIHYLNIPVLDHSIPTPTQLNRAVNWIDRRLNTGRKVVVHCALGRGRSVLMIVAYLVASGRCASVDAAEAKVRETRLLARLNRRQARFLNRLHAGGELRITRSACLIVNPVAGAGKWPQYQEMIEEKLSPFYQLSIKVTSEAVSARTLAKQALDEGHDLVIAGGGDGTLAEVAGVLVGRDTLFGILPLGTANALAHALFGNISKLSPMETALAALTHGHPVAIDTASCNGETLLLVAALGFEEQMISHADRAEKDGLGQAAYLQGFWKALVNNEALELEVQFDGGPPQVIRTSSLVVANASPITSILAQGGGLPDHQDGKLDITWLRPTEEFSGHLISMLELLGAGEEKTNVVHAQAKSVCIRILQGDHRYVFDGETRESNQLEVEVVPASLHILVPDESRPTD